MPHIAPSSKSTAGKKPTHPLFTKVKPRSHQKKKTSPNENPKTKSKKQPQKQQNSSGKSPSNIPKVDKDTSQPANNDLQSEDTMCNGHSVTQEQHSSSEKTSDFADSEKPSFFKNMNAQK